MSIQDRRERKWQRFLKENAMVAVIPVEVNVSDYNYRRGGMDYFEAIVAVDLTCKRLTE